MNYFVEEKNCLMNRKQYEAKLNRLSPVRRLLDSQFVVLNILMQPKKK